MGAAGTALETWAGFALQFALLAWPAWRLAERRLLPAFVYAGLILEGLSLYCWLAGRYDWSTALTGWFVVCIALFCLRRLLFVRRWRKPLRSLRAAFAPGAPLTQAPRSRLLWLAGGLALALALAGLWHNVAAPPAGYDALTYHLDFPLQWLQEGRLHRPLTAFGDQSPSYYPLFASLVYGWFLLGHAAHSQAYADVLQLPWLFALYFALRELVYRHARPRRPVQRLSVELAALLVFSLPYLQSQALVAGNDVILLAYLALAWLFLERGAFALGGAAAGLACAVKYSALPPLAGLLLALAIARLVACVLLSKNASAAFAPRSAGLSLAPTPLRGDTKPNGYFTAQFLLFAICGLALAAPWYAWTWSAAGNPLYPAELQLFGATVFAGYYPPEFFAAHPFHAFQWYAWFTDPGLVPLLWPATLVLALASLALLRNLIPSRGRRAGLLRAARWLAPLLVPLFCFAFFLWLSPLRQHRLGLPAVVLAAPALALWPEVLARTLAPQPGLSRRWFRRLLAFLHGLAATGFAVLLCAEAALFIIRLVELFGGGFSPDLSEFSRATALTLRDLAQSNAWAQLRIPLWLLFAAWVAALALLRPLLGPRRKGGGAARVILAALALSLVALTAFAPPGRYAKAADLLEAWNAVRAAENDPAKADVPFPGPPAASETGRIPAGPIGVVGSNALAPLRGPRNRRRVELVLAHPGAERPLHLRGEGLERAANGTWRVRLSDGSLAQSSIHLLRERIARHDLQSILISRGEGQNWPDERVWLQADPRWRLVFERNRAEIYARR